MRDAKTCETCAFNVLRPDMKNVKYCAKRNFPIYADGVRCSKYIYKKSKK